MSGQQQIPAWLAPWLLPLTSWSVPLGSASPGPEFIQPINPGWTFGNVVNVTEANSSSPALERAIVAEESYGRQLGHVIEALVDLIGERLGSQPQTDAMKGLLQLNDKIARVKAGRIDARLAEIQAFLVEVRKSDAEQYARVADALRSALAAGDV